MKINVVFQRDSVGERELCVVDLGSGYRLSDTPEHWLEFCRGIIQIVEEHLTHVAADAGTRD